MRIYLKEYRAVLGIVRDAIRDRYGCDKADEFFADHCSTLEHLSVVNHFTRKVDMLTPDEIGQLEIACAGFATAFRLIDQKRVYTPTSTHDIGTLTVKGHAVECHVVDWARRFGTCGALGEDGMEALHPLDTAARWSHMYMAASSKRIAGWLQPCMHDSYAAARASSAWLMAALAAHVVSYM